MSSANTATQPCADASWQRKSAIWHAVSVERRTEILLWLGEHFCAANSVSSGIRPGTTANAISRRFNITGSTTLRHLRALRAAGLVVDVPGKPERRYAFNGEGVARAANDTGLIWLASLTAQGPSAID